MYLILVAEDNDLQREDENDCLIIHLEPSLNVKMRSKHKQKNVKRRS